MLVEETIKGGVRTVTMNRPEKRNAPNDEMLELLHAAFSQEPTEDEPVTVLCVELVLPFVQGEILAFA